MNKFTAHWSSIFYNEAYFYRKYLYQANEKFSEEASGILLDFGCGDKPYESLYTTDQYIGLDFSNTKHTKKEDTATDVVEYDGKNIPFQENSFDNVISTEVVEHLFNLDHTLQEVYRTLKPGGTFFFTCPFSYGEHEVPYDYARYTRFALLDLLEKNNFEHIYIERTGNMIVVMLQYLALYLYYIINHTWIFKPILFVLFISPLFIVGELLDKILPEKVKRPEVYLNNIVRCSKPL